MKSNKLNYLLLIALFSFSSCDGIEKKISNTDANQLTITTINKTNDYIKEMAERDFVSTSVTIESSSRETKNKIVKATNEKTLVADEQVYSKININGNQDLLGL